MLTAYIIIALLGSTGASVWFGSDSNVETMEPDTFFGAIVLGALWPLTLPTFVPYFLAVKARERGIERAKAELKAIEARKAEEKLLAVHMPEVEKALTESNV
jgi:hypothetical protein